MQLTTIFTSALIAAFVVAAPTAAPAAEFGARSDVALIDLWQDPGFLGLKFTGKSTVGTCKNLRGTGSENTGFDNNVSSAKAKPGFRCTVWQGLNCAETGFSFNADPGASTFPSWIDNRASSWKCVKA